MHRLLLVIVFAIFFSAAAHAQPILQSLNSGGLTVAVADDAGGNSTSAFDLVTYLDSSSDAGQLSQPGSGGAFYQDCTGSAAVDSSVAGPSAPYSQTNSDMTGTQNGIIPSSSPCVSSSSGAFIFEFGFFSPTFFSIPGGDSLPVAFRLDGVLDASAVCTSGFLCGYSSSANIQVKPRIGPVIAIVNALSTGPTSASLNFDTEAPMWRILQINFGATSNSSTQEPVLATTGSGSSTASVNGLQLTVNFGDTEAAIKLADPTLSQATIDAGLADLEVHVTSGIDLPSFAPQFPQTPPPSVPAISSSGLAILALLLVSAFWIFGPRRRAAA